jgi:hypothetical protein
MRELSDSELRDINRLIQDYGPGAAQSYIQNRANQCCRNCAHCVIPGPWDWKGACQLYGSGDEERPLYRLDGGCEHWQKIDETSHKYKNGKKKTHTVKTKKAKGRKKTGHVDS